MAQILRKLTDADNIRFNDDLLKRQDFGEDTLFDVQNGLIEALKRNPYPLGDYGDVSENVSDAFGQVALPGALRFDCLDQPSDRLQSVDLGTL